MTPDDTPREPPRIDSYTFGRIVVDGEAYTKDVIITPDGVRPEWWRERGHRLTLKDLGDLLDDPPDVLIIGIGANGVMSVPDTVADAVRERGIELIIEKSGTAVETYNRGVAAHGEDHDLVRVYAEGLADR